jgi:anaerobic magnesium-protoporphyrin IX monomethyl ester cyclase
MKTFDKILLINADYPDSHYHFAGLPVGIGYISEVLSEAEIDNQVFDLSLERDINKLKKKIETYRPSLIGYSLFTFRHRYNYKVMENIKKAFPSIPIVAGGPHLSTLRESVLMDCEAIDFGVTLEGERTLVELCEGKEPCQIKGLIYRDESGKINYSGDREFIRDLDSIPSPRYKKFNLKRYPKNMNIVTSRGCPYSCIYCPVKATIGKMLRVKCAESVVDDFEYWHKQGFRDFSIADDNFTFYQDRVYDIAERLKQKGLTDIRISCGNGVRADKVSYDLLKRMKEVGFYYLAFGVEGGNDRVLKNLKKGEDIETIRNAVKMACDLGYQVGLFFLIGSPYETRKDLDDSIKIAQEFPVCEASFYNLIPFPNTELYEWVKKNDYFVESPQEYLDWASHWVNKPLFATPEFPYEERKKAYHYVNSLMKKHVKKEARKREAWLIKQKLHDYYGISGFLLDAGAWVYTLPLLQGVREEFLAYIRRRWQKEDV